jgi:hypothetical protein
LEPTSAAGPQNAHAEVEEYQRQTTKTWSLTQVLLSELTELELEFFGE